MSGAFETENYRNLFKEYGYPEEKIEKKLKDAFETVFYGTEAERFYHEVGEDMGYLEDTGNHDVRTEGMSYGMMVCVQLNKKEEFDRIWKWVKTYMWMSEGAGRYYFRWSCSTEGSPNSDGPAPDGEEFFAMSLFFASHRWGDGTGIFNYSQEAKNILKECVHKGENGNLGEPMWDRENKLIKFIPGVDFTDPSYHLPHFYELFAQWSYEEDRSFWEEAAKASREYLKKACHPVTGLCAEYAEYDGTPCTKGQNIWGRHDWYYSDAYRTIANIALDYAWFGADEWEVEEGKHFLKFFCETAGEEHQDGIFAIDGTVIPGKALHPVAMTAVNAQAGLLVQNEHALACVRKFWNTPLRTGNRRYYDNCLYFFAFLALSGNYRIY